MNQQEAFRYESPEAVVRAVMLAAQKCRSNTDESDLADVGAVLFPTLYEDRWDNVLTVADRLLANGRRVTAQDAANLMFLVQRDEALDGLLNVVPMMQGFEPFPEPMAIIERFGP